MQLFLCTGVICFSTWAMEASPPFPSVVDAVRAAIVVQHDLRQDPVVPLRIGIHQGDITYDTQGPYGDSVNIASRIESLGTAGSILVSAKPHDEIKNQPDISTTPFGEFEPKERRGTVGGLRDRL